LLGCGKLEAGDIIAMRLERQEPAQSWWLGCSKIVMGKVIAMGNGRARAWQERWQDHGKLVVGQIISMRMEGQEPDHIYIYKGGGQATIRPLQVSPLQ
jgi:hypothetical protein